MSSGDAGRFILDGVEVVGQVRHTTVMRKVAATSLFTISPTLVSRGRIIVRSRPQIILNDFFL